MTRTFFQNHPPVHAHAEIARHRLTALLPILSLESIHRLERDHSELMDRAGEAIAQWVERLAPRTPSCPAPLIVALVGSGNNGGDALCALKRLVARGYSVALWMPQAMQSAEGQRAWQALAPLIGADSTNALWATIATQLENHLARTNPDEALPSALILDGFWGMGWDLQRPITPDQHHLHQTFLEINRWRAKVPLVAIDLPSGLCATNGWIRNEIPESSAVIHADLTIALLANKPGYWMSYGQSVCGDIVFEDLGVRTASLPPYLRANVSTIWQTFLPSRPSHFHKGLGGDVVVIGGRTPMLGAGLLSCEAALMLGAGRVFWHQGDQQTSLQTLGARPEIIHALPKTDPTKTATHRTRQVWLLGPGLGQENIDWVFPLIESAPATLTTIVWDADALLLLPKINSAALRTQQPMVMTPHPLEAARLLGWDGADAVQSRRMLALTTLAQTYKMVVVLKGAGTLIATPEGKECWIHPQSVPCLGTAGSGDVLAGAIASYLAQGLTTMEACLLAVALHAQAGMELSQTQGRLLARELIPQMRQIAHHALSPKR